MEKKLNFTDQALKQINTITNDQDKKFFRITVQGGGCSGFKYSFELAVEPNKDDIIISGSVVDFKKEMIGESFIIDNPKATASCGCGLSFSI